MTVSFRTVCVLGILAATAGLAPAPARAQMIVDGSGAELPDAVRQDIFEVVTENFRDPATTQFRRLHKAEKPNRYCGEVNTRNMYGALVGFKPFAVVLEGDQRTAEVVPSDDNNPKPPAAEVRAKQQAVQAAGCQPGKR